MVNTDGPHPPCIACGKTWSEATRDRDRLCGTCWLLAFTYSPQPGTFNSPEKGLEAYKKAVVLNALAGEAI